MPTSWVGWLFTAALVALTWSVIYLCWEIGGWILAAVGLVVLFLVVPALVDRTR